MFNKGQFQVLMIMVIIEKKRMSKLARKIIKEVPKYDWYGLNSEDWD